MPEDGHNAAFTRRGFLVLGGRARLYAVLAACTSKPNKPDGRLNVADHVGPKSAAVEAESRWASGMQVPTSVTRRGDPHRPIMPALRRPLIDMRVRFP